MASIVSRSRLYVPRGPPLAILTMPPSAILCGIRVGSLCTAMSAPVFCAIELFGVMFLAIAVKPSCGAPAAVITSSATVGILTAC